LILKFITNNLLEVGKMAVKKDESIQKKPWFYRFEINGVPYKKRGFRTKAEALAAEATARDEVSKGIHINPSKTTFGVYLIEWLQNRRDLRDSTKHGYAIIINQHIIPAAGRITLGNLNAMTIESILGTIESKGLSESFNRNVYKVIHKSLSDAESKQLIQRNPASFVSKPKITKKEMAHWSPEEAKNFLAAVSYHRLSLLFVLALHCGMRQGEILGLRMSDIDLENKKIYIRNILNFKKQLQVGTKTAAGTRSISISPLVICEIEKRIRIIEEEKRSAGESYNDLGFLICTKSGLPIPKHHIHNLWTRLLEKTGMRKIRFHDLRHTCASLLLTLGIHPKVVQERLGHTSFKITMDLYSHIMPNMQSEASDALENLLK
jgi:integrase